MKKFDISIFIVCIAAFFSTNLWAGTEYIVVRNFLKEPIQISSVGSGYCVDKVEPASATVQPWKEITITLTFTSNPIHSCAWVHSSHNFSVDGINNEGESFSGSFEWYLPAGGSGYLYLGSQFSIKLITYETKPRSHYAHLEVVEP